MAVGSSGGRGAGCHLQVRMAERRQTQRHRDTETQLVDVIASSCASVSLCLCVEIATAIRPTANDDNCLLPSAYCLLSSSHRRALAPGRLCGEGLVAGAGGGAERPAAEAAQPAAPVLDGAERF